MVRIVDAIKALRTDVFYRMGFNDQEIVALSGARASNAPSALATRFARRHVWPPCGFTNSSLCACVRVAS